MNPQIIKKYEQLFGRYIIATSSPEQTEGVLRLLRWMVEAETKEDFLLYIDGIDVIGLFSVKFMKMLVRLDSRDSLKQKAIELNVIRRKR